jgi:hypothetical protein
LTTFHFNRIKSIERLPPKLEKQRKKSITCSANATWSVTIAILKWKILMLLKKTLCNLVYSQRGRRIIHFKQRYRIFVKNVEVGYGCAS